MDSNSPAQPVNTQNPVITPLVDTKPAFMSVETPSAPSSIPPTMPPTETPPPAQAPASSNGGNVKKIAAVLGLVLLLAATGTGVVVLRNSQLGQTQAWDCNKYNFTVSRDGIVTVINGSTDNVPPHKTTVTVDAAGVGSFDVPALSPGQSSTLGQVSVPAGGSFTWEVAGSVNCTDSGSFAAETVVAAQCTAIAAYTQDWVKLTLAQLSALEVGDTVRLAVSSLAVTGSVDKVRFIVNGETLPEIDTKNPATNEFYDDYTIPANTVDFKITAQVHNQLTDAWY